MEIDRTLLLALLIALFGGVVAATAGFGFSLVAAPPLLLMYEPVQVTAMLLIITMATRWMLLLDTWRSTKVRAIGAMLPTAWLGIGMGIAYEPLATRDGARRRSLVAPARRQPLARSRVRAASRRPDPRRWSWQPAYMRYVHPT